MTTKDIAIVIPGMNTKDYVQKCLESLERTEWRGYSHEIIYVDNGSVDNSVETVATQFPYVKIISNEKNLGFCKGANQGAAQANSRYILHLNNDTLLSPDSVPLLAEFLDHTPEAAVVGSRLLNPDLSEQWSARRFPSWFNAIAGRRSLVARLFPNLGMVRRYLFKDELQRGEPFAVDWVPTPCMMVRSEVFQRLRGFPEQYYYWHEAIFCTQIQKAGYKIFIHPRSKVIHFEGKGGGPRPYHVRRWHIIDFHRGAFRFYCEHHNIGSLNPLRWFAGAALATRALLLLAANRLAGLKEKS